MRKVRSLTALATVTLVVAGMSPLARSDDKSTENNTEKPILCQGNYHSEADAVRQLARMASTYSNLNEWRARARKFRTQILGGAKLDPLPSFASRHSGLFARNTAILP